MATKSYLDMTDEELANAPEPEFTIPDEDTQDDNDDDVDESADDDNQDDKTDDQDDTDDDRDDDKSDEAEDDEEDDKSDEEDKGEDDDDQSDKDDDSSSEEDKSKENKEKDKKSDEVVDTIDYKAAYNRITAPFKANGRDIAVKSIDDAITLMQKGANYTKKMEGLKPHLQIVKLLEQNGLLDTEKLSFLIDLEKKNPEAINKLVKDSGIDPMDISDENAAKYQKKQYSVDEREVELDNILDDIKDSKYYQQTLNLLGSQWDKRSKQAVADDPNLIKVINDHMNSGVYDLINNELEHERMLGKLNGMSDIEAYKKIGDAIQERGGFNHLFAQSDGNKPAPKEVTPKPKREDDDKLKDKRKAASSSKPTPKSLVAAEFSPLNVSDEDFDKIDLNSLIKR